MEEKEQKKTEEPITIPEHSASAGARLLQSRVYTAGEMKADSKPPRPDPPTPFFLPIDRTAHSPHHHQHPGRALPAGTLSRPAWLLRFD